VVSDVDSVEPSRSRVAFFTRSGCTEEAARRLIQKKPRTRKHTHLNEDDRPVEPSERLVEGLAYSCGRSVSRDKGFEAIAPSSNAVRSQSESD